MLRPIGTLSMIRLMLHGATGKLGEAQSLERFKFYHMVVRPTLAPGRRGVKVAFDGEVTRIRAPFDFRAPSAIRRLQTQGTLNLHRKNRCLCLSDAAFFESCTAQH